MKGSTMAERIDLTGQRFGRWTAIERISGKATRYLCRCDCGNEKTVDGNSLKAGGSLSCGCLRNERVRKSCCTHKMTGTKEYRLWAHIHDRCYNPNTEKFPIYGGRGIRVCDRWHKSNPDGFKNFLSDAGKAPNTKATFDRINSNGNYEPDNCRWTDYFVQNNNRSMSVRVEGVTKKEMSSKLGRSIGIFEVMQRRGYTVDEIMKYQRNKQFRTQAIRKVIGPPCQIKN